MTTDTVRSDIEIDAPAARVAIEVRAWNGARFEATLRTLYAKDAHGAWTREA